MSKYYHKCENFSRKAFQCDDWNYIRLRKSKLKDYQRVGYEMIKIIQFDHCNERPHEEMFQP